MSQTILITGASRGLGLELARQYGAAGWKVIACCREPENAPALNALAGRAPAGLDVRGLDVTDSAQIARLAGDLRDTPIDVLFNNAGIYGPRHSRMGDTDEKAWMEVLRVNVVAPLKVAEAFTDHVAASRRRVMAFMSSLMGSLDDNGSGGYVIYRSSKAALNMVVKNVAVDLRPKKIISVAICPGWVRTDMGGPGAPLAPEESVAGIRKVIDGLTLKDSGSYISWDGERNLW